MEDKLKKINEVSKAQQDEITKAHKYLSISTNRPELIKQYFENPQNSSTFPFEEYFLNLNMQELYTKEMLTTLSKIKLPIIRRLRLVSISGEDEKLQQFLKLAAPENIKIFDFNTPAFEKININYYSDSLSNFLTSVTKEVFINNWVLDNDTWESIVKGSVNSDRIVICNSTLDPDNEYDFSGPEYKTTYFSIQFWGSKENGDWGQHPERLERLIHAICNSYLRESLITINICGWNISDEEVVHILKNNGVDNINVVSELNYMLNC